MYRTSGLSSAVKEVSRMLYMVVFRLAEPINEYFVNYENSLRPVMWWVLTGKSAVVIPR
jgi:hypothetical protein